MNSKKNSGQALIEYLFIFGFVAFISITLVRGFTTALGSSVQTLGYALTQQLTIGVCSRFCFFNNYENKPRQ